MSTYTTEPKIPVTHVEKSSNKGWLLGAGLLALGAVIAGAALMGDDDYDQMAYNDDVIVTEAEPVRATAVVGDDDDFVSPAAATTVEELLDDDNDYGTLVLDNDDLTYAANDDMGELDNDTVLYSDMSDDMDDMDSDEMMPIQSETTATYRTEVMSATETRVPYEKINDTVGEILQADGEPSIQDDGDVVMADGHTVDADILRAAGDGEILDNAIAVPGTNNTVTTVMCPTGTTAQPDMTCEITGDYDAELVGEDEMVAED